MAPTGFGKSFLASAVTHEACRDGYVVFCSRASVLARDLAMTPLNETERPDFWEMCEGRYQTRSTILTSQIPVATLEL